MNDAWTLLKGNPAMRDAQGRAINHPAAMVYESLASRLQDERREKHGGKPGLLATAERRATGSYRRKHLGEELSDMAERMRKPTRQMKIRRDLERGGNPTFANLRIAQQMDQEDKKRLSDMRQDARDETSHEMAQGNRFPEAPNYGVERQQM